MGGAARGQGHFFFGAFGPMIGMEDTIGTRIGFLATITALQAIINHIGIGLTAKLTDFSGSLILITSVVLALICLAYAPSWDIARLFTFHNYSGAAGGNVWPEMSTSWAFLLGLLLPIYTITGYDASAHTSEETRDAAISVPKGMVSSVLWSSIAGYIVLCAFVLMLPDMDAAAAQGWNVFFWAMDSQVPATIRNILYIAIFLAQFLCGLATVTSVSRMIFAFSRDGGLPASKALSRVDARHRTPVAAIWTGSILSVLFVWGTSLISFGETSAYAIVVSCTVIFLFFSFAIPIIAGLFAYGGAKWPKMGPWNIGRGAFMLAAIFSSLAMVLIFVLGVQPPNNSALYITLGFLVVSALVWILFERRRFAGPPVGDEIKRRQTSIRAAESAVGETD
jgi:amino acid transporter